MLIFAPPPINIVALAFAPILLLVQKYCPKYTVKVNGFMTKILFSFIALVMFAAFVIGSLIMMPFAYLKGCILYPKQT